MEGENLKTALLKLQNGLEKSTERVFTCPVKLDASVSDSTFNFKFPEQVPMNANPKIQYVWCYNRDITSQVTQTLFNRDTNIFSMIIKKCYDGGDICNREILVSIIVQNKPSKVLSIKVKVDSSIGDAVFEFLVSKDLEEAPKVHCISGGAYVIPVESESYNKDTGIFTVSFKKVSKSLMWNISDCDVDIEIVY